MSRSFVAPLVMVVLLAGSLFAAEDQQKTHHAGTKTTNATITNVNAQKGTLTVKFTGDNGKTQERTFHLTSDVRLLDETGRAVNLAVFASGNEALVVQSEGKLTELRRLPTRSRMLGLPDTVRTLIEMAGYEPSRTEELQQIYTMLRKLDTNHNGQLNPQAVKTEANRLLRERVQEVFSRLDTNKDGKISREEARGLIKENFNKIDTNKDGYIEFNELLNAAKERHEHAPAHATSINTTATHPEKN
jgi:Ca2+-binding EF-hand superfamily protein